ncbi:MAG: GGDEF domain-containing protein [Yokenella regensburgei]|uniref:GGDEF domain-containing protein n=1 Tax=Yokenella regensburgei TaxID=158877 RepID=UPI002842D306|nr:GGDEF domain-containing protein [Yokenella regensburgei]
MMRTLQSRTVKILCLIAAAIIVLTSILSWWLVSDSYQAYRRAQNDMLQFSAFDKALHVSNALAAERAWANEMIFSAPEHKVEAWRALRRSRRMTDSALAEVPAQLLSPTLLAATIQQLTTARRQVDTFLTRETVPPADARAAINAMLAATDGFHAGLFRKTSQFIRLEPAALGQILRAQALGELRDASGRLGSALLIPLYTREPVDAQGIESISRGVERVHTLWWLLQTQGPEIASVPEYLPLLKSTEQKYAKEGTALIQKLKTQSINGEPYSLDASTFARQYHASVSSFNHLLDVYLEALKTHYAQMETRALQHLLMVLGMLSALYILTFLAVFYSGTLGDKLSKQTSLSEKFKRRSEEDSLTGLFNRRAFDSFTRTALLRACANRPVWLLVLDIDHFKQVNDTWGHPVGDRVLVSLSQTLTRSVRHEDVIARIGGEEFAIFLRNCGAQDALRYAHRLQRDIRALRVDLPEGGQLQVTASIGIASGYQCALAELFAQADKALYWAKRSGRDCIRASEPQVA